MRSLRVVTMSFLVLEVDRAVGEGFGFGDPPQSSPAHEGVFVFRDPEGLFDDPDSALEGIVNDSNLEILLQPVDSRR